MHSTTICVVDGGFHLTLTREAVKLCCIVSGADLFNFLYFSLCLCVSFFFLKHVKFLSEFQVPLHAVCLNMGSSAKTFSTRLVPSAAGGHWAETVVGKASMVGSIFPGIWGSGFRGRVTPTSGPPAGTSGKEGRVMGRSIAGSILTVPSGWSWAVFSWSWSW